MKKLTVLRAEMKSEAQKAEQEHREVKIFEKENTTHGRIMKVIENRPGQFLTLIMR